MSDFLGFSACKSYTWTQDIVGRGRPYSPKEGTLNTLGEWTEGNTFPTTSLDVPHVMRSFLFRKIDSTTNACPLIGELTFRVRFMVQKAPILGVQLTMREFNLF